MRLKDKVAIITGAGSGIGRGTAVLFAREGAKVVVGDWSAEGGEETVRMINQAGGEAFFLRTDVSKSEDINNLVQTCLEKYGRVDVLMNNAGILKSAPVEQITEEDWEMIMAVNLKSVFLGTKRVLPEMLKQGGGKIINVASIAGLYGFENLSHYCASKGGIIAFTRAAALEYAPKKININCIAPGAINTGMTKGAFTDPKQKALTESQTPIRRVGEPQDIANAALYLASNESDFVTGHVLIVDGGWTVR